MITVTSMLSKNFNRQHFEIIFHIFFPKIQLGISYQLSSKEGDNCMKCQILFSGKMIKTVSGVAGLGVQSQLKL